MRFVTSDVTCTAVVYCESERFVTSYVTDVGVMYCMIVSKIHVDVM